CRLLVEDLHVDEHGATVRLCEKGGRRRTIGLHFAAAQALQEYVQRAGLTSGPLFHGRRNSRSDKLGDKPLGPRAMYHLLMGYLARLPGAMRAEALPDGRKKSCCIYTPHSLRATTATLLLGGVLLVLHATPDLGYRPSGI